MRFPGSGRWLSSFALRQSLALAAVMLAATALFGGAALVLVDRAARADLADIIDTDVAALADAMESGGAALVLQRIRDRMALDTVDRPGAIYLLVAPDGRIAGGNLAARPATIDPVRSTLGAVRLATGHALMRATMLRGGYALYVGRSLSRTEALVAGLRDRLLLLALGVLAVAFAVGMVAARRLERGVARVNAVFDRFGRGELAARIDDGGGGDEFARLGRNVNEHLSTIARLIETQREISDNIAHELRTPLVHLDTRLRRALDRAPPDAVAGEIVEARADIGSIVSLFDALLDIALGESVRGDATMRFDLSELAADVADLYAASAEEAGLDFATRLAPGVEMVGEPMQVSRMLTNLLDNAFKFCPAGSRVRLVVAGGPRIVVEDNGPGIAPHARETVFQRFRRAGADGTGHGLGLALVKVIATRHGLAVRIEDAAPGARFVIERVGGEA